MNVPAVLVPLDGSVAAAAALPVGQGLARALGAPLQVIHVSEPVLPADEADRRLGTGADVTFTAAGDPAVAILAAAHPGTHIVMSRHCGHPRVAGLGSVAERVLRAFTGPVVLVPPDRGEAPWEPRALVLPLDGTPASACAVPPACHLANATGGTVLLLHVADAPARLDAESGAFGAPRYTDQPQHEWPAWRDEFAERAACGCSTNVRVELVAGSPAQVAVRAASEADLVVVAWHGVLDGHGAVLRALLQEARCPVMVVRAG